MYLFSNVKLNVKIINKIIRHKKFSINNNNNNNINNKVVIISGASSGIGEELSYKYTKLNYNVIISARRENNLINVKKKCDEIINNNNKLNNKVNIILTDVSNELDCKNLINNTIDLYGKIDILILNAGIGQSFFLEAMKDDINIKQFMDINYYGCIYPTIYLLKYLNKHNIYNDIRIGIVSSLGGIMPFPRQTLYNASKYALIGFYNSLRLELANRSNISISMICPGFIKTEITMGKGLGRDGKPINEKYDYNENKNNIDIKSPGGLISMISASDCANEIVNAIEKRKKLIIIPKYPYSIIYQLRKFFPNLIDYLFVKMFVPNKKKN